MKHFKKLSLLLFGLLFVSGCSNAQPSVSPTTDKNESSFLNVSAEGYTTVNLDSLNSSLTSSQNSELSQAEIESLKYMREEEKLAHDLYLTFYDLWEKQSFANISQSESSHTAAVKALLDHYHLPDPTEGKDVGEFSNATLQNLYDQLKSQGESSLVEALKAGAAVEEIDILDLQKAMDEIDNNLIDQVYANLMQGSRNHLRAYVRSLKDYQPVYLDEASYQAIVGSDMERGGPGAGRGR